jgi:putative hydrolase of the HAD superfamily
MVDVDGVLVSGRPEDGRPWSVSLEEDLGLSPHILQREFFESHWNEIVLGRVALMDALPSILARIAPHIIPEQLVAYWFRNDSRLDRRLIGDFARIRGTGMRIYLAV